MPTDITQYTKFSELINAFRNSENPSIIEREKLLSVSDEFSPLTAIAKLILSGHFELREGERLIRIVKPTCVEMYYHEEPKTPDPKETPEIDFERNVMKFTNGPELITDFIVYHRNKPGQKEPVNTFTPGSLHNHQSGIDITFEHEREIDGVPVVVRASALIRGFCEYKTLEDMRKDLELRSPEKHKVDDRSTYCYNALYDGGSIFGEGLRVQWTDGDVLLDEKSLKSGPRQNVPQFTKPTDKDKVKDYAEKRQQKKTDSKGKTKMVPVPDERPWQFKNILYYR